MSDGGNLIFLPLLDGENELFSFEKSPCFYTVGFCTTPKPLVRVHARKPACRCVFGVEVYPAEGGVREKVRSGEAGAAEGWSCGKERSGYGLQLMRGTCSLRARGDERHASGVLRFTEQEGLH